VRRALALACCAAAAQYLWNACAVAPLVGYDGPAHAGYLLTLALEGRLPLPREGWQTFHPPLYYLLAAGVWRLLEPAGPTALIAGVRAVGALPWLLAGWVSVRLALRLGTEPAVALVAGLLFWWVPCAQLAAVMVGNEALAAAMATFALPFLVTLQREPADLRAALAAGLFAGLAFAAKYSGLWVVAACAVPWLRRGQDARALRAFAALALVVASIAGPVYVRNVALTGSVFPMTRDQEPLKTAEAVLTPRPRRLLDYLRLDPGVLLRPSIYHRPGRPGHYASRNPSMAGVWNLAYASMWYDPFGQRTPVEAHRDGVWWGPALLLLGLAPTALMLLGFAAASREALRQRARSPDAPLVAMAWLALAFFVAFTWHAPTWGAVKASYFLPVAGAAAVFFGRGAGLLAPRLRRAALALSAAAALLAAAVFTSGLVFEIDPRAGLLNAWRHYAAELPGGHLDDAIRTFYGDGM
jgi:hypothetical protein